MIQTSRASVRFQNLIKQTIGKHLLHNKLDITTSSTIACASEINLLIYQYCIDK